MRRRTPLAVLGRYFRAAAGGISDGAGGNGLPEADGGGGAVGGALSCLCQTRDLFARFHFRHSLEPFIGSYGMIDMFRSLVAALACANCCNCEGSASVSTSTDQMMTVALLK